MTSKRDAAIALAKRGFRVFPLAINSKVPAHAGADWRKTASKDPERVAEMWTDPVFDSAIGYNIGVALDGGTLVVDIDTRDGKQGVKSLGLLEAIYDELPATYTVKTASGGEHRYFQTADSRVFAKELAKHVDLKGEGGYVVGPGSEIDGRAYVGNEASILEAPAWIGEHAPRQARVKATSATLAPEDSLAAIARATDWLKEHAPDHGTYAIAARVKDFGVSEETALNLMLEHWRDAKNLDKDDEHVAFRVSNAYRYGQNAVGSASPEAEFGPVEIEDRPAKRRGLYAVRWSEAKPILDRPYLIDDVIDLGAMVVTYGDSNVGKTYVKLDQCFHIAAGMNWNGHKVRQGLVVYVAAEGGTGFIKRIEAYKRRHGVSDLPFSLVPCPIDLQSEQADTAKLIKLIREEETYFGQKCVMVVIDTLARAMAGGDENTAVDMGRFVGHADRLRAALGATVDVIHHTGKDKAKGARGSSALRAATDTELEVDAGVLRTAKQRDMPPCPDMRFSLQGVEIGVREDGKPVTGCVVAWLGTSEFDDRVSPGALEFLDVLERVSASQIDAAEATDESGSAKVLEAAAWVTWTDWQAEALIEMKGSRGKGVKRTTLFGLRKELSDTARIEQNARKQWRAKRDKVNVF